jgi:hypothetical protein
MTNKLTRYWNQYVGDQLLIKSYLQMNEKTLQVSYNFHGVYNVIYKSDVTISRRIHIKAFCILQDRLLFRFQSKQSPGQSQYILTLGKQSNFLGPGLLTKIRVVHRALSKKIQVNPLKIKGKYVFIHSSPVSKKNHSSQNYVPLRMQNAPSVCPTQVAS